jgi:hypothetical protein
VSVRIIVAACLLLLAGAAPARAQSANQIGLVITAPAAIGFDWEISEHAAIRPDLVFSKTMSAQTGDSWGVGAGLSAPFYVMRWAALRMYLSPRFTHSLNRSSGFSVTTTGVSGSVGGMYALAPRFSVFAETGAGYTHQRTAFEQQVNTVNTFANRSVLGAVLFF